MFYVCTHKPETDSDVENKHDYQRGEGVGGTSMGLTDTHYFRSLFSEFLFALQCLLFFFVVRQKKVIKGES